MTLLIDNRTEWELTEELERMFNTVIKASLNYEQAEEYGHSLKRELAFLTVHSMLHLMGYDHMEEEEEKEMIRRQKDILNSVNITR